VELPSPFDGTIKDLQAEPGQQINVGAVMAHYELSAENAKPTTTTEGQSGGTGGAADSSVAIQEFARPATRATREQSPRKVPPRTADRVVAAPSVRRMARRLGIDLMTVQGSGPNHRILIDDLATAVQRIPGTPPSVTKQSDQAEPSQTGSPITVAKPLAGSRLPIRGLRRTIAERMTHANQTVPHFSYIDEVDVTDLVSVRNSLKDPLEKQGIKLTYLPFFIKAAVAALQEVPHVNASIDTETNEIVFHDQYHVGVATDSPSGLIVPVLRDADKKDIAQIARELAQLTELARAGKAKPEQLRGSTFTVTSIGSIGGLISTPIINEPEVGILGIGKIVKRPRFDDAGSVRAADIVYLSFSFDHRVVDGAVGARFANSMIARLNQPATMLFPDSFDQAND
jgi:pyruvate dehydrogenase E2 component (dihydrolipoamide acetyltransferase)/2-oxoisovalerate dehydrogenase E2 component (dihydrolipoyl transacylase)